MLNFKYPRARSIPMKIAHLWEMHLKLSLSMLHTGKWWLKKYNYVKMIQEG